MSTPGRRGSRAARHVITVLFACIVGALVSLGVMGPAAAVLLPGAAAPVTATTAVVADPPEDEPSPPGEPEPDPTVEPTPTPDPDPTAEPTPTPSPEPDPTDGPTPTPEPDPTAPTPEPGVPSSPGHPTPSPTPDPTPDPTSDPTPDPTPDSPPGVAPGTAAPTPSPAAASPIIPFAPGSTSPIPLPGDSDRDAFPGEAGTPVDNPLQVLGGGEDAANPLARVGTRAGEGAAPTASRPPTQSDARPASATFSRAMDTMQALGLSATAAYLLAALLAVLGVAVGAATWWNWRTRD